MGITRSLGWFVWQPFFLAFEFTTGVGFDIIQSNYEIDSKAMRKAADNDTMVGMIETSAAACQANAAVRILVKVA